jgi:signal transduction histidine kinase
MITLKTGAIKPSRLVEIAFAPFANQFSEKDIAVEFHMPYTLPLLSCDIAKIAWTLTILFSNAVRYTPQWGKLVVKAFVSGANIQIFVENSGYGVPLERLQRMFERSENYDSPEFGQGLALILAREIVEAHAGHIGVSSELGVMTRFYIELPIENLTEDKV